MATEVERSRLAREIHDTLAQGFAGIVTQLQASEQAPEEAARSHHVAAALALARAGLDDARRSVQALRPAALDAVRLPEALENVARNWSTRTGIQVEIATSAHARTLPMEAEVALLRTAQEALANIERHAGAHQAMISCRSDSRGTCLVVRDDGRGFDPSRLPTPATGPVNGGYGLVAMRERIESVAGELRVDSRPGCGTTVRAEVPS
jgi:signal transduction histidine kinase